MSKTRIRIIATLSTLACLPGISSAQADQNHAQPRSRSTIVRGGEPPASASGNSRANGQIQLATKENETQSVSELKGKKVTGSDQVKLGQIEDFVVDTQTGKLVYTVVSSGGVLGLGEELRLLQQSSLQASTTGEEFTAQLDQATFDALPVIAKNDLKADRVARVANPPQPSQSPSQSGLDPDATTPPVTVTASPPSDGRSSDEAGANKSATHLVLASELKGKEVQAKGKDAGTIEDIALDVRQGTASALFKPEEDFAGTEATFKVPFASLQLQAGENQALATTLDRTDFAHVQSHASERTPTGGMGNETFSADSPASAPAPVRNEANGQNGNPTSRTDIVAQSQLASSRKKPAAEIDQPSTTSDPSTKVATTDKPAANDNTESTVADSVALPSSTTDQALTPTGRGDSDPRANLAAATSAIRSALANDAGLSGERIEVKQAGATIALEGEVESEAMKRRVESIARVAADGARLENKIKVKEN